MPQSTEIVSSFGSEADKPEIISLLSNLSKLHALSIDDLYIKWEQFSYNQKHESATDLNLKNLDQFKQFLQTQMEKHAASVGNTSANSINTSNTSTSSIVKPKLMRPNGAGTSMYGFNIPRTPTVNKKRKLGADHSNSESSTKVKLEFKAEETSISSTPTHPNIKNEHIPIKIESTTSTPTNSRIIDDTESGKIIDSLNPRNMEVSAGNSFDNGSQVKILPYYDPSKYKFRTMRQNLVDSSDVLDEQIENFAKVVQDHYKLSSTDFGDPTIQSQTEIYTIGRIVPDSLTADGFLNIESLSLETSRMSGIGRRIPLKFENIDEISLFCGQIAAFKGKNANGEFFLVDKVLELPYPQSLVSTEEDLLSYKTTLKNDSSKIVVTTGPYVSDSSFDLSLLSDFVNKINSDIKPNTVIMFGPFIDVSHPLIMNGDIPNFPQMSSQPKTLEELFIRLFVPILRKISPTTQVILIPSTKDAISNHASYPQDSFDRKSLHLPKNFKCFTNPSTFQLNEAYIGCSNVDVFKDMKEIIKGGNTSMRNRFDRIAEHVLQQRRFYPVFPGSTKKTAVPSKDKKIFKHISGADLEIPYLGLTEFVGNSAPDIIIVPSEMYPFARVIKNVIFINPGKFIKPKGGRGTHAQISIVTPNLEDNSLTKLDSEEALYLHNIWNRSRTDIVTN